MDSEILFAAFNKYDRVIMFDITKAGEIEFFWVLYCIVDWLL